MSCLHHPLALLAIAAAGAVQAQEVVAQASVDRASIHENESFNYTIRVEGGAVGDPDVSFLEQQFDILNRSAASRINLLNGRTQQVYEWTFQLMPKRAGQFTLPALQFGSDAAGDEMRGPIDPGLEFLADEDSRTFDPDFMSAWLNDERSDLFFAYVKRKAKVWVEAQNRHGRAIKLAGEGLLARALQHELDHLAGKLYIDHLDSFDELIPVSRLYEEEAESEVEMPALA